MKGRLLLPLLLCAAVCTGLFAQISHNADTGGDTPAERYYLWARQAFDEGRYADANAALVRAADYASESSDISFLQARLLSREGANRRAVLSALERALAAGRWKHHNETEARLLAVEQCTALRNYSAALTLLAGAEESAESAALRLAALKGALGASAVGENEFRAALGDALNRYPRETRLARIFLDYAAGKMPSGEASAFNRANDGGVPDRALMDLVLSRLPFLLEKDPHLAWRAAPFISDTARAFRLVAAYRTGSLSQNAPEPFTPEPESIAAALNLGIISDERAAEELFGRYPDAGIPEILPLPVSPHARTVIDRDLIRAVNNLLRAERGRKFFTDKLLAFTGIITADDDRDGYAESRVRYTNGMPAEYSCDWDQDGTEELSVSFSGGVPQWARALLPQGRGGNATALVHWEQFPAVLRAEFDGAVYIPRPGEFQFAPVDFTELPGSASQAGLLYPRRKPDSPPLGARTLVSYALQIQKPSAEFQGGVEWTELDGGIPKRAFTTLNGQLVSAVEFDQGAPVIQRADLDFDSRMETTRRFRAAAPSDNPLDPLDYQKLLELSESDWNGDGLFEYAELYRADGSVVYSWDMDGDGVREYSETRSGNQKNEIETR